MVNELFSNSKNIFAVAFLPSHPDIQLSLDMPRRNRTRTRNRARPGAGNNYPPPRFIPHAHKRFG